MASPWVNLLSNQAGGGLNAAMKANNALANENVLRQINQIKKQYMPLTTMADINSKNAYARLVGLQPFLKTAGNENLYNPLTEEQKNALRESIYKAGGGQVNSGGSNSLNNMSQQQGFSGTGQPSTNNMSGYLQNVFKGIMSNFGQNKPQSLQQNPLSNPVPQVNNSIAPNPNAMNLELTGGNRPITNPPSTDRGINNINDAQLSAYDEWLRSPEGQAEQNKGENGNFPTPQQALEWQQGQKTNAEKTSEYKSIVAQGTESGTLRAKDSDEIGKQQLLLSNTGSNLDKLIDDFNDPNFMSLRDQFPYLQDTQLGIAAHTGSKQQQEMIGKLISDLESFKGSTVNSFKGQTLKREFDYADKLKPSEKDTVYTALGKLQSLKALKEIAYQKNDLINGFLTKDHMSLADAVKKADKMIDIKAIDKQVKDFTLPTITIRNNKTGNLMSFTRARAEELGIPHD